MSRGWRGRWTAVAGLVLGALTVTAMPAEHFFVHHHPADLDTPGERWACPMMDFIGSRAGTCPVCGMDMALVTAGELTREQGRRMGVEVAEIVAGPATATIRAAGSADYDHRFTRIVIPRVAGRIVARHPATFGCCQEVAEGEPIIELSSPEVRQAQADLQAALALGDARLVEALSARFERWHLTSVAAAIRAGGQPQETVTIVAPFGGTVLLQDQMAADEALMVGREVTAETPLLRLVDPDRLVLIVHVPERQAPFLAERQPVVIEDDVLGPVAVEARIGRVGAEILPETRSVEVRIFLTGVRGRIRPGALVMARIQATLGPDLTPADPEDPASWGSFPLVPASAVLSTGVRHVAWRLPSDQTPGRQRFEPVPLVLGLRLEDAHGHDRYVVRAGLAPGDRVAVQGAFLIDSQAQLAGTPSLLFPTGAPAPAAP